MGTADVRSEAAALFALTWPTYIALLCEVGMSTVAAVFLGRTGSPATLGGAYLGISLANVLASAPIMGVATAQGTLSAQANGAGRPHLVGLYLQRGLAVNLGISLLVLPLLWWPTPLLWFLVGGRAADGTAAGGQGHVVAVATSFLRAYSPVLLPLSAYDALRRYLLAQDIATPLLWSSAAGLVANLGLHALLVSGAGLGILGSAVALVVAQVVNVAVLVTIILSGRLHTRTWGGWAPARAASNLRPYLALGLPGLVQVCAEWWAMEGTLFLVARYGAVPLAAHAALMNVSFLAYLAPLAVGTAASTRVGAALGRGAAAAARRAAWVAVAAGASTGVATCSVIWGARAWWPRLYVGGEAEEGTILAALAVVLPVFAVFGLSDTLQAVLGGVLRGSGRQSLGAYGNAAAFWVVGLPAGGAQVRRAEAFVRGGEAGASPTSSLLGAVAGCGSPEEPPTPALSYSPLLGVAVPGSRNEGAVWAPEEMPPLTMPAQSAPVSYGT
ncbi:hypothetical protein BU14_0106s0041 [Porphyra umbilicalis]|uniref:Multidrug and toxic compound extrusion protein n=1 Tax=Porphyra umbilicalis TaxID=2786 RepID=A0A1X6PCW7_PORUM|nr:hypothetical protein BU14_0106s0041 [Porphyra umbilicalis]|eukprot:OSX78576.1 hypothetical protein BU14_0106s0041 [Porphyra umbilicalis]